MTQARIQGWTRVFGQVLLVGLLSASVALPANAGPREQAKRIHDRLAGVPPTDTVLTQMENLIAGGDAVGAANAAMDNVNFYNVTLKNFAAPWTNRDQSVFVPLNDYIATVIGMIRDDEPFNTVLSADITYTAPGGGPAPSAADNNHYANLEATNANLRDVLARTSQSSIQGIPSDATAGVMTSRAAAEAFFIAGTNRAMFRFTFMNHMCSDLEPLKDLKLSPDRIRQDVSRSPGGDSRLFLNNCIGCHTGMDPMAQAFAYYNFNETSGRLEYSGNGPGLGGTVQPKYFNNNANFPQGFATPDDAWENRWRDGQNAYLGFSSQQNSQGLVGEGNGAKTLGEEFGNSEAFASCQVRKVFKAVCLRNPENPADRQKVDQLTTDFMGTFGYRMKDVFAETAVYCMGQ